MRSPLKSIPLFQASRINDRSLSTLCLLLGLLLASCHGNVSVQGNVKNQFTSKPVSGADVFLFDQKVSTTDSLGNFNYHGGRSPYAGNDSDPELLISKDGYKQVYIDIEKGHRNVGFIYNVSLEPGNTVPILPKQFIPIFYTVNLIISVINIATLLFIAIGSVKNKWLWFFGVCLVNFSSKIIYLDGVTDISLIHGPLFCSHYSFSPLSIHFVIPVITISFWINYLRSATKKTTTEEMKAVLRRL